MNTDQYFKKYPILQGLFFVHQPWVEDTDPTKCAGFLLPYTQDDHTLGQWFSYYDLPKYMGLYKHKKMFREIQQAYMATTPPFPYWKMIIRKSTPITEFRHYSCGRRPSYGEMEYWQELKQ